MVLHQLSFLFVVLLILVSFVHSFVVLSPQDVSRIGRELSNEDQHNSRKQHPLDVQSEANAQVADVDNIPSGLFVKVSLRSNSIRDNEPWNGAAARAQLGMPVKPFRLSLHALPEGGAAAEFPPLAAPNAFHRLFARMSAVLHEVMKHSDDSMVDEISGMKMESRKADNSMSAINMFTNELSNEDSDEVPIARVDSPVVDSSVDSSVASQPRQHHDHRYGRDHDRSPDGNSGHNGDEWRRRMIACRADVHRFCTASIPNHKSFDNMKQAMHQIMMCLSEHEAQLSWKCSSQLSTCTSFQCASDAQTLCPTEMPAESAPTRMDDSRGFWHEKKHKIMKCLESKAVKLSGKCLNAINERRRKHGQDPIVIPADDKRPPSAQGDVDTPSAAPSSFPHWTLIAIVGICCAFVFMAALTVVLLIQHKRKRQRAAVLAAANSLNIPPPPTDVIATQAIRVTEEVQMPYYRMDEVQSA